MNGITLRKTSGTANGFFAAIRLLLAVILLCGVCALTFVLVRFISGDGKTTSTPTVAIKKMPVIVIDAGHGGIDSGAVGVDGTLEKNINLSVSQKLAALCSLSGIEHVITRTDDRMLVDDSVTSHKKMNDLKNRLKITQEISDTGREVIFVSIHMNNFPSPKYSGLQVWYSKNEPQGKELAAFIQGYARTWLDTSNTRQIKAATSAIYVLDRATVPSVLIECGFLSNPEECQKLGENKYQTDLALTVFSALCEFLTK